MAYDALDMMSPEKRRQFEAMAPLPENPSAAMLDAPQAGAAAAPNVNPATGFYDPPAGGPAPAENVGIEAAKTLAKGLPQSEEQVAALEQRGAISAQLAAKLREQLSLGQAQGRKPVEPDAPVAPDGQPMQGGAGFGMGVGGGGGVSYRVGGSMPGESTPDLVREAARSQRQFARDIKQANDASAQAADSQRKAIEAQYQAVSTQQQAEAALLEQQEQAVAKIDADRQARENFIQGEQARLLKDMDAGTQEVRNMKIDPSRWMSGGRGVGAAIAVALGALGSALTGQRNTALDIVQQSIDRDIDAQKAAVANKREGLQDMRNLYAQNLGKFQDERAASLQTRNQLLESYKMKLQQVAAQSGSQGALAKAQEEMAKIDATQARNRAEMSALVQERSLRSVATRGELERSSAMVAAQQSNAAAQRMKLQADAAQKQNELTVNGLHGQAKDKETRRKAEDEWANYSELKKNLNTILDMRNQHGVTWFSETGTKGEVRGQMLRNQMRKLQGMGTLSEEEYKRLSDQIPDPGAIGRVVARIEELSSFADESAQARLGAYGFQIPALRAMGAPKGS